MSRPRLPRMFCPGCGHRQIAHRGAAFCHCTQPPIRMMREPSLSELVELLSKVRGEKKAERRGM